MRVPVCIPTKGRASKCDTLLNFLKQNSTQEVHVFCEPHEYSIYKNTYGPKFHYINIQQSEQGLAYVRNFILTYVREFLRDVGWVWILDDDIQSMGEVQNSKQTRKTFDYVMGSAFDKLSKIPNLGLGALQYSQYGWAMAKSISRYVGCEVAVLLNVTDTRTLSYRPDLVPKEDRDFCLQVLNSGLITARTNHLCFRCPSLGKNSGGLHDLYKANRDVDAVERMIELWGSDIAELKINRLGRPDLRLHYKRAYLRCAESLN